jgi:hypothetical protein
MNDADRKKAHDAILLTVNMQSDLTNTMSRAPRAAKYWAEEGKKPHLNAKQKAGLKALSATAVKLAKDAKVVHKDLLALQLESKKMLDKAATGKEYRDKYAAKRLASSKAFDVTARKFAVDLGGVLGGGLWPGMNEPDPQAARLAIEQFVQRYAEMRIALGRL